MGEATLALQERDISKGDARTEIRVFECICVLTLGEFRLPAALISYRQQHQKVGRLRLIVQSFAQVRDSAVDLTLVDLNRRAQSQCSDVAPICDQDLRNQGLRGSTISLADIYF